MVHAPNWVGDAVLALPALRDLSGSLPENKIWMAARDWVRKVFAGEEFVSGFISLPRSLSFRGLRRTAGEIRGHKFDAGLLLPNSFGSALIFYWAGIPERWGYARNGRKILLTRSVPFPPPLPRKHQWEFYRELVSKLGFSSSKRDFSLTVSPEEKRWAEDTLSSQGINLKKPVAAINPGAYYGAAKRWPPDYYARLSELMDQAGVQIVIIGSPSELPLAEEICRHMSFSPVVMTGKTDIRELAGILTQADLCVTNDSGPMHLANALKIPVVALFGPTDPEVTRPFQSPSSYIQKKPVCWPCSYRECPFDHRCMKSISPEEVFSLCRKYLQ